jgi:hypothetical protein
MMGGGTRGSEGPPLRYCIYLKSYAAHNDTLELLRTPLLQDLKPTMIFDQEKNRGFVMRLEFQQVCDIYNIPIVSLLWMPTGRDKLMI